MSGTQQNAGQSGQQGQDAGSGQQQGSGSGQQPAQMSDKAAEGLANLLGSFALAGFQFEVVDPKKDNTTPPAA